MILVYDCCQSHKLDSEVFGITGSVYDCIIWLRLFSSVYSNETASTISAKSACEGNKMLKKKQNAAKKILSFYPLSPTAIMGPFSCLFLVISEGL